MKNPMHQTSYDWATVNNNRIVIGCRQKRYVARFLRQHGFLVIYTTNNTDQFSRFSLLLLTKSDLS